MSEHTLGAIELIELGDTGEKASCCGRPYLGRNRRELGFLADIGGFLAGIFETGVGLIADIVDAPLQLLAGGVDFVFVNIASVIGQIPILGELVASVLLIANAAIKFVLSLPGLILREIQNVFKGLREAFEGNYTEPERDEKMGEAKKRIVDDAPNDIRKDVDRVLTDPNLSAGAGAPPAGTELLTIALPAAAAAGLLLAVAV